MSPTTPCLPAAPTSTGHGRAGRDVLVPLPPGVAPQVLGGLLGALVVDPPPDPDAPPTAPTRAPTPSRCRTRTAAATRSTGWQGRSVPRRDRGVGAGPADHPDPGPVPVWVGGDYRVLAVDSTDLIGPTPVPSQTVTLTTGGRVDLEVRVPDHVRSGWLRRPCRSLSDQPGRPRRRPVHPPPNSTCCTTDPQLRWVSTRARRSAASTTSSVAVLASRRSSRHVVDDQRSVVSGRADVHGG